MDITLSYSSTMKEGVIYLWLGVESACPDIARFLEDPNCFHADLNKRILAYLKNIGVIDKYHKLTNKGESAKKGMMYKDECGKYHIKYVIDDMVFKNRILNIERFIEGKIDDVLLDSPSFTLNKPLSMIVSNELKQVILQKANSKFKEIKNGQPLVYERKATLNFYNKEWQITNDKEELECFSAFDSKGKYFLSQEDFITLMQSFLGAEWNADKKIYSIEYKAEEQFSVNNVFKAQIADKRKFRATLHYNNAGLNITYKNIPIMPKDLESAKEWLNECLTKDLEESYHTQSKYDSRKNYYLYDTSLSVFSESIDFNDTELLDSLKETNKTAFWHCYATRDLMPVSIKAESGDFSTFTLKYEEIISLQEIVDKMTSKKAYRVIFIDRYVRNKYQIHRTKCFLEALSENVDNCLVITSKHDSKEKEQDLHFAETKHIYFERNKLPHDRYILLHYKDMDKYVVWTCSQSDFLIPFHDYYTKDAKANAYGATFTLLKDMDSMPNDLKDFLLKEKDEFDRNTAN